MKGDRYPYKNFQVDIVRQIFERDKGACVYCGAPAQVVDHVIPGADGGQPRKNNGVCACRSCNTYRGKHPQDIDTLTRAIFWLMQCGEDTSWMDEFYNH